MPNRGFIFGKKKRHAKLRVGHSAKAEAAKEAAQLMERQAAAEHSSQSQDEKKTEIKSEAEIQPEAEITPEVNDDFHEDGSANGSFSVVHSDFLLSLLSSLCCKDCHNDSLELLRSCKKGLALQYKIYCPVCDTTIWSEWTSPQINNHFDINSKAALACRDNRVGFSTFKSLISGMGIAEQMTSHTFQKISKKTNQPYIESTEKNAKKRKLNKE